MEGISGGLGGRCEFTRFTSDSIHRGIRPPVTERGLSWVDLGRWCLDDNDSTQPSLNYRLCNVLSEVDLGRWWGLTLASLIPVRPHPVIMPYSTYRQNRLQKVMLEKNGHLLNANSSHRHCF
jgi:hypothetical protein